MRAIFLLTTILLGAVSANEIPYYDEYDELGFMQQQSGRPTGEPVTYKSQESTTTSPTPVTYKSEDDTTKSPMDYVTYKSEEPTSVPAAEAPKEYTAGRTYTYWYEAQILTGNPEMSSQYTGYQLRCRVLFSWSRGRRVVMRLQSISFRQTNRVLPVRRPVVLLPSYLFKRLSNSQNHDSIVRMLQLPVSFLWTSSGWVKDIQVSKRDTFWSLNLKKGIMTMLNFNMRIKLNDINQAINGIFKRTKYYEDGVDGHCKTSYEYRRFPYTILKKGKLISITKTRDLAECSKKPWFNHMLFLPNTCSKSRAPIIAKTKTRYTMTVVGRGFFLRNIRTGSQYAYNERDVKDGSITSFVVQRMHYIGRMRSSKEHTTEVQSVRHTKGLMLEMPIPEWEKFKPDDPKRLTAAKLEAVQILRRYIRDDLDMYANMRNFIQIMRRLSKNDILKFMTQIHQEPEMKRLKNKDLLHNILPKVATKEVVEAFLEIIKQRSQPDDTTAMLVSRLSGMSFVNSGRMIKKMMDVAMSMKSTKQRETYKSLLFTIGKLINTHHEMPIPVPPGKNDFMMTPMAIKSFYQQLLPKRSTILSPEMHKITVIGSLGNCGLVKPCLDLIEPFVLPQYNDRRPIPRVVRVASIYALTGVAEKAPQRVRKLVLPILYDVREDVELRFGAYEIYMASQPGLSDLKLISEFMTSEPVRQLRTYIATHLNILSRTKDRCYTPLALNASRILREMPPEIANPEGLQFSRVYDLRVPLEKKIAMLLGSVKITPKNFFPRQINVGLIARMFGLNIDVGRGIVRAEDIQRLLDRLMGPDGTARTMKSLKDLLKPIVGNSKIDTDYLAGIAMYKGVYGITGLSKEVTDTLKKGLIPVPQDIYRLATIGGPLKRHIESLTFVDQVSKIPTSFGVPMIVNHTLTAHLKIKAVVVVKPKLLAPKATVGLRAEVAASYRYVLHGGPDMTIISSFVDAMRQGHVPRVTGGIRVGWVHPRSTPRRDRFLFRVNVERPEQDKKILHLSGRLATAQSSQRRPFKPQLNHMQHRSLPVPRKTTMRIVTNKPTGLAVDIQHRMLNFTGILPLLKVPLVGPKDIKIIVRRTSRTGGDKGIDFAGQVLLKRTNLRNMVSDHPTVSPDDTLKSDDLFSRKASSDEAWLEEDSKRSSDEPKPTEEPPQMFTPEDDDSGKSGPAFFSESPKEENNTKNYTSNDQPEFLGQMNDEERKAFFASQLRLKSVLLQVVMRLDNLPINGSPSFNFGNRGVIFRMQAMSAILRRRNGFAFHIYSQKRKPNTQTIFVHGVAMVNRAIMKAKFIERQPLNIIDNMMAHLSVVVRVNRRNVAVLHNSASMGNMWKSNIRRIIRNPQKQLPAFREIERCLRDFRRRLTGTPACYQAWKDINALSMIKSSAHIAKDAPQWLKQSSVLLFNYLRWSQIDALRISKYVPSGGVIQIRGDWELSPYNQRLVSGYQRMLSMWDRYVNARLLVSRRNSIIETPSTNLISNMFDGLYPARCDVVRRGPHMSWRTFDHVHRHALSKLSIRAGRVVLVQDIKKRLLVTEQKSRSYRITHIRFRQPWQHVLIVAKSSGNFKIPRVFFRGRFRRLPFKLYNRKKQLTLAVYRDPTPRSRWSLTAVIPKVGCTVRTNPAVSTEIRLSPFFHSNVRGICGDFNGEKLDDPKGPMCRAIFPDAQTFLRRYTTLLQGRPPLRHMEYIPSMRRFLRATQCPDAFFYPMIIR